MRLWPRTQCRLAVLLAICHHARNIDVHLGCRCATKWGPSSLGRLRVILAILIAVSLALTPVTSALAALHMADQLARSAHADMAAAAMSDCHGSMQPAKAKDCPCCDTPSKKAPCQDGAACLINCGMHVLAILAPSSGDVFRRLEQYWPADPEKPPDWSITPPAPPPRT